MQAVVDGQPEPMSECPQVDTKANPSGAEQQNGLQQGPAQRFRVLE
jgi:hypothetical protein